MKTEEQENEKSDTRKWFKMFVISPRKVGTTNGIHIYTYGQIEIRLGVRKGYIDSRLPGSDDFNTQFRGGS